MKKIYKKPEMKAIEIQAEQFIATSTRTLPDFGDDLDKDGSYE